MKSLHQSVRDYVKLRRSFGYKYGTEAKVLREFARFMSAQGLAQITTAAALRFAMVRPENKASTKAQRYAAVRHFAHDCRQHEDPLTERPPPKLVVGGVQRAKPYFCSELEIQRLLATAQHYRTSKTLLPVLYHCLFGLLVVTGMRVGEALGLEDRDIDWENALLSMRGAKYRPARAAPSVGAGTNPWISRNARPSPWPIAASFRAAVCDESRHGAVLRWGLLCFPPRAEDGGSGSTGWSANAPFTAPLCGRNAPALVSTRGANRPAAAGARHLSGSLDDGGHLLVPQLHAGVDGRRRRAFGPALGRR